MEETKKITDTMREQLRKSFPDSAYSKHPTKTFLTTLKAMYVTERLNDVFGVGRWSINTSVVERVADTGGEKGPGYVLVEGTFESLDYGVIVPKQYGGHKTEGKNTEIADGYKSAVTDCQSKIASYLEIGIDLFKGMISPTGNNKNTNQSNNDASNNSYKPSKAEDDNVKRVTKQWADAVQNVIDICKVKKHVFTAPQLEQYSKLNTFEISELEVIYKEVCIIKDAINKKSLETKPEANLSEAELIKSIEDMFKKYKVKQTSRDKFIFKLFNHSDISMLILDELNILYSELKKGAEYVAKQYVEKKFNESISKDINSLKKDIDF